MYIIDERKEIGELEEEGCKRLMKEKRLADERELVLDKLKLSSKTTYLKGK